jgi:hypothetical membrane protein
MTDTNTLFRRLAPLGPILLILAGATILMGIVTAEALFPAPYDTGENTVSGLGSTWQPGDDVREPSATIFNLTMVFSGLMIAAGSALVPRLGRALRIAIGILGVAVFLVGLFPGEVVNGEPSTEGVHPLVAMVAFVSGGVAAVLAFRVTTPPFRYLSLALGLICLTSLVLNGWLGDDSKLGEGGVERWVAYPVVLWIVALGSYLLGSSALDHDHRPLPRED